MVALVRQLICVTVAIHFHDHNLDSVDITVQWYQSGRVDHAFQPYHQWQVKVYASGKPLCYVA